MRSACLLAALLPALAAAAEGGPKVTKEAVAELLKEPIQWEDGYIIPPTRPGLGVELDEQVAAAHPYEGPIFIELENSPIPHS